MSMRRRLLLVIFVAFIGAFLQAQSSATDKIFTISVTSPHQPKDVQLRYFLSGEFGTFFSSTATAQGNGQIVIRTEHESKPATSLKVIAYAPGCEFVTLSIDDLAASDRQGAFECQKLPTTLLRGRVPSSVLGGKDLQVELLYVVDWAAQFFKMGASAVSPFFLTKVPVATDGTFAVDLPDFSIDPLWSSISKDASIRFHLIDAAGNLVDELAAPASLAQGNNLKVAAAYPGEIQFAVARAVTQR